MKRRSKKTNKITVNFVKGVSEVPTTLSEVESKVKNYLNPIAENICKQRYYQKDEDGTPIEDWNDLAWRVVNHVCKNESQEFKDEIHQLILSTRFLPNSPCLHNAGTKTKSSGLSACFIAPEPDDTWMSMTENIANFGHIARQGGGAGVSLSKIRPEGDPVFGSTHAKACGPVEHMRMLSEVMNSITQSGFRSMAMISVLRVDHPDIIKFIKCKQKERALKTLLKEDFFGHYDQMVASIDGNLKTILDKFLHNFNISVLVTDDFMKKVEADGDFDLVFNGKVYETIKAKELFRIISENAWKNGDPGLLFYDALNDCPYKYGKQEIVACNPCVTGDTLVTTFEGPVRIKDIVEKNSKVLSYSQKEGKFVWTTTNGSFLTKENASIIIIKTTNKTLRCTPDHRILTEDGFKKGENIKKGEKILCCTSSDKYALQTPPGLEEVLLITEQKEKENVYDLTANSPDHNFIANGLVVHNCGEIGGPSKTVCQLGSVDLSKFYDEKTNDLNWNDFKKAVHAGVRFLDDVIDVNTFPTKDFEKWSKNNRPIGLGVMGFADLLLKMKITYGKKRSLELAEKISEFMSKESHKESVLLAKERGTPEYCQYDELGHRRNIVTLSIAPNGTTAQIAGCSHSIEPIFSPTTIRQDNTGKKVTTHPDSDKSYFRCAVDPNGEKEISYKEHIAVQAAFQKYVNNSISKTINLNQSATIDDVENAYMLAWRSRCKGVTIYRDGSKSSQVLNTSEKRTIQSSNATKRPRQVTADIFKTVAQGFEWHVIVGKVDDNPYELFAVNGKTTLPEKGMIVKQKNRHYSLLDEEGNTLIDNLSEQEKDIDSSIDKETRRFSLELRHGIPPKFIVQQIDKSNDVVTSFAKAVSRIFRTRYIPVADLISVSEDIACPECAKKGKVTQLVPSGGCWQCLELNCHYSRCG